MPNWTEELETVLIALWKSGRSATIIGHELGISRSAAIGKIKRIEEERGPIQRDAFQINKYVDSTGKPTQWRRENAPYREPRKPKQLPAAIKPAAPMNVSLVQLEENMCRYTVAEKLFCGLPTEKIRPRLYDSYCAAHKALTRAAPVPRRKATRPTIFCSGQKQASAVKSEPT